MQFENRRGRDSYKVIDTDVAGKSRCATGMVGID
jgi:hypothetical protein